MTETSRARILIKGKVQGVGFRPYIYNSATYFQLTGWTCNSGDGLVIEIQGSRVQDFLETLKLSGPPLAIIDSLHSELISLVNDETSFNILDSIASSANSKISPEVSICEQCLTELFNPNSRFYLYPFINCTQCGPRYSIMRKFPYDRTNTTMSIFPLCALCERDYQDPSNRRFHAQPTACKNCGPHLSLTLDEIARHLKSGKILAIKSLGGYQLICDARNENTIATLRERKSRSSKPFALMAANIKDIKDFAEISSTELELLSSWKRPIVLLRKKNKDLPEIIAPGLSQIGVMLPYTPLHYLLFHALAGDRSTLLIVTSANAGGSPLIAEDEIAERELKGIADFIVTYNRRIVTRLDDSVLRVINNTPVYIRRARGFVPEPILLSQEIPCVLAVGSYLKNTICLTRGNEAFVSQHIGNLNNAQTICFFHETITHFLRYLNVKPEAVIHDLHPDFYSTQFAQELNLPTIAAQHHHAHLAAVAAEHHLQGKILGLALDGSGWGEDRMTWGGEMLLFDHTTFQRLGSLLPMILPGGDKAAKEPWRMGASLLYQLGKQDEIKHRFPHQPGHALLIDMMRKQINSPLTTSCGRLFDAASALLQICEISHYEGHAAMLLEAQVSSPQIFENGWSIQGMHLNLLPLMRHLLECTPEEGANVFHGTLAKACASWILYWSNQAEIRSVVLSGGCFLNKFLSEMLIRYCEEYGLSVYVAKQCPPSDAGISLGQAWIGGNYVSSHSH